MKGDIYSRQRCPLCGGRLVHDEKRNGCYCQGHLQCGATKFFVRFGKVFKNFHNYFEAYQFLQGLRFKFTEGTFDARDYQKDSPLGFSTLTRKYIKMKEQQGLRSITNIRNYMKCASNYFGQKNIKTFTRADVRDFLYRIEGISEKTRHNYMSCIRDFFKNLVDDEIIEITQMPRMPKIEFELGYRKITDIETQTAVLDKIKEISYHLNEKIWLGCDMLSLYVNIRPKDLLNLSEGDIDLEYGVITVKRPTKKKGRQDKITVRLIPEHIDEIRSLKEKYSALPHVRFFRHVAGVSGVQADAPYGEKYFYKWAKKACEKLGITNLDLYGLTRHSTVTALAKHVGEEGAKKATGHYTNKAFERYCQYQDDDTFEMIKIAAKMKGKVIDFERRKQK
jgi:integrase